MAIGTERFEIGSHTYAITTFNTSDAIKIWTRLAKVVGGPLGELFDGMTPQDAAAGAMPKDGVSSSLGRAAKALTEQLDSDKTLELVKELLKSTHVEIAAENGNVLRSVREVFDSHFAGGKMLAELSRVVAKVVEVNYSDFLSELRNGIMQKIGQPTAATTQLRSVSNG